MVLFEVDVNLRQRTCNTKCVKGSRCANVRHLEIATPQIKLLNRLKQKAPSNTTPLRIQPPSNVIAFSKKKNNATPEVLFGDLQVALYGLVIQVEMRTGKPTISIFTAQNELN